MTVAFDHIPAAGLIRTPLFFIEINPTAASTPISEVNPTLIVASKLATGTGAVDTLYPMTGSDNSVAKGLFGEGSSAAEMVKGFRDNDAGGELSVIVFADDGGGVASVWTLTVTGPSTGAGTLYLYIAGQLITVAVASGDAANDIAIAIDAALTAATDLPVTNGVATNVVTLTSRHLSEFSAQIDVQFNYAGLPQAFPAGVAVAVVQTVAGSGNPDTSTLAATIGDNPFDYLISPFVDSSALDDFDALMNDVTGRWAWNRQIYGHVWVAKRDTVANLGTLGNGRNNEHVTILGMDPMPSSPWTVAAAAIGRASQSLNSDPARGLQTLDLINILPAKKTQRFQQGQRNTLLFDGIATFTTVVSEVQIERLITTKQLDASGNPTDAFLDVTTLYTLMRFNRRLRNMVTSSWPRMKLADDGTPIPEGASIVTPAIVKGGIVAEYDAMVQLGWVENIAGFAESLVVVRPAGDPNRLDILVEPDLINQLRIFAVQNRFRLQYPTTAL